MFGGICFFVHGNIACGILKQEMIVRLSDEEYTKALKRKGVRNFEIGGRQSNKGWVLVSAEGYKSDKALASWMEKGLEFARSLPKK